MPIRISPRSGGYRRIMPFLFSSPPRRRLEYGSAKQRVHARPVAQARAAGEPGAVVARDGDARRPAADARRWEPVRESGNATSSRRHARAATRAHRRSHDGRWRLRGLARLRSALRRGGAGDVASARPRARLQPFRPVRPSGLVLVGREPRVAPDLPADAGRAASRQTGHLPDARAVADLDPDDLEFLFRQVRIYFSHGCDIPSDWLSGRSPIQRVLHFHLDNGPLASVHRLIYCLCQQ